MKQNKTQKPRRRKQKSKNVWRAASWLKSLVNNARMQYSHAGQSA